MKHLARVIFVLAAVLSIKQSLIVHGAEKERHRPLIQTTTLQEEYQGKVCYGGMTVKPEPQKDIKKAYANVCPAIVKINAGDLYGSGVIWEMKEKEIIIVSNRHLLENWNNDSFITFGQDKKIGGKLLRLSETYDLGFIKVDTGNFSYEELLCLREAERQDAAYKSLEIGDPIFSVGAGEVMYEGTVADPLWYIEEWNSYMLYGFAYGKPGMSGGGTFDAYGNFIGMLTGGTGSETVSIPVTVIMDEYMEQGRQKR